MLHEQERYDLDLSPIVPEVEDALKVIQTGITFLQSSQTWWIGINPD